jgi:hypothetical protein
VTITSDSSLNAGMTSNHSIFSLPPEVFVLVTDSISGFDITRLWLSGNRHIQHLLSIRGGLTQFVQERNLEDPCEFAAEGPWPLLTSHLERLEHISFKNIVFGISDSSSTPKTCFAMLPRTLQSLKVSNVQFWNSDTCETLYIRIPDIVSLFPSLESLVYQVSMRNLPADDVIVLSGLSKLRSLETTTKWSSSASEFCENLPRGLESLVCTGSLHIGNHSLQDLPPKLTRLTLGNLHRFVLDLLDTLPSTLEHLAITSINGCIDNLSQFGSYASSLVSLELRGERLRLHENAIPRSLISFILSYHSLELSPSAVDSMMRFPESIQELELGPASDVVYVLGIWPHALRRLSLVSLLTQPHAFLPLLAGTPPLETLVLTKSFGITDEMLRSLPRTIKRLEVNHVVAPIQAGSFPPNLTRLEMQRADLGDHDVLHLPRTLLHLKIGHSNFGNEGMRNLPNLTRLILEHNSELNNDSIPLLPPSLVFCSLTSIPNVSLKLLPPHLRKFQSGIYHVPVPRPQPLPFSNPQIWREIKN